MWNEDDLGNNTTIGGGFLNKTTNESGTPGKPRAKRLQSIVPVAIRQLRDCQEEDFQLFGKAVPIVQVVGILRDFEIQSTKATYRIEDHTGEIRAVWWLENEGDTVPNLPSVKEGNYVQLFGSVRSQDGGRIIMILKMFPVDDCNIVTSHLLQVVNTRLYFEYSSKKTDFKIAQNNPGAGLVNSMRFMDDNPHTENNSGLTPMQEKVFKIFQNDHSTAGVDRSTLLKQFPANKHREVNEALEFLNNEGHIYSTIDNDHYRVTTIT